MGLFQGWLFSLFQSPARTGAVEYPNKATFPGAPNLLAEIPRIAMFERSLELGVYLDYDDSGR